MALYKEIRQPNGVITKYHRILFINQMINSHTSIAVLSYIDDISRNDEKNNTLEPYKESITYETVYTEDMNIENAYKYLKTLSQFEGSIDI